MARPMSRRRFTAGAVGVALGSAAALRAADDKPAATPPREAGGPSEAALLRDYPPPRFQPVWKKPQLNRLLVQDFVVYAHSDLEMTKRLLVKEPALLNAAMDWGGGDWETGLGGASHMGRRDIAEFLLAKGARIDLFCAAMLGLADAVKAILTVQPQLIDARGPHGFTLHFHAQVGGKEAAKVLDYLQSIKKVELKPNPFLKTPMAPPGRK
jgi:hypothetical protein